MCLFRSYSDLIADVIFFILIFVFLGHSHYYVYDWGAEQPVIAEQNDEAVLHFEADLHHFLPYLSYYVSV